MRNDGLWTSDDGNTVNDNNLFIRFHMGTVKDAQASALAGCDKHKDVPFITIAVPGDKSLVIDRPVWDDEGNPKSDTQRFSRAWLAFKSGHGDDIQTGSPLLEWAAITRAQVEDLGVHKVRTVEQLAGMSDANCQRFLGSLALRQKARDWLASAERARPFVQIREELEKKDGEMAALRDELQALRAAMSEKPALKTTLADDFVRAAEQAAEVAQAIAEARQTRKRKAV